MLYLGLAALCSTRLTPKEDMFDFVRNHNRILQFILLVLIVPAFVLTGVYQGYHAFMDSATDVARIDGQRITEAELENAHREQVDRLRRQMPGIDAKLFDSPEMRAQSLELLVRDKVVRIAAAKANVITTDARLQRIFATDPQLAFLRNADNSLNESVLVSQGMSAATFERRLRDDLTAGQYLQGITATAVASKQVVARAMDAYLQQREVQVRQLRTSDFLAKVNPTPAELEAFYKDPSNSGAFQAPESAEVEYVVLDLESLKKQVTVTEEDARKLYTAEVAKRFSTPEERRASHILIKAEKDASSAERAKAKAKAQALLAEAKKSPAAFAELARKNSDDPGSAERGGDLDFFGRGAMVKPFEDVAFGLKPGETSDVVETDFGYHIIHLVAVRGGEKKSFESVRGEIETELKAQAAQKRYAEASVEFTNLVYEQPDSLKPAADKFKLEVQTARGITRKAAAGTTGPLANAKLLEALFAADALRNKRNTEAVEVGPSQLASARVREYSPARRLPMAEVAQELRTRVAQQQAKALARKEGEAALEQARKTPAVDLADKTIVVSRVSNQDLPQPVLDAVLKARPDQLPRIESIDLGEQGVAIFKVVKVLGRDQKAGDEASLAGRYAQSWGEAETQAYTRSLRTRLNVQVRSAAAAASGATDGR